MESLKYNLKYLDISSVLIMENTGPDDVLISIIIPTYNRFELLKCAVASAINQKNSHLVRYEIIVMDNNPDNINNNELFNFDTDCSNVKLRYYVNSENIGMMANWNRGIELAKGKWIIQLHDDDYFLPHFIDRCFEDISRFDKVDAIVHSTIFHDKRKTSEINLNLNKKTYSNLNSLHVISGNYHISGALIKKDVVFKLGGFNLEMYPISDYDFNERLIKNFKAILIENDPLVVVVFEENETLNPKTFTNWFSLERIIKNNAVSHLNKIYRYILTKIIDVQINAEIDFYIKEIFIDEEAKKFISSKKISVSKSAVMIWEFYKRCFRAMNLILKKDY